MKKLAWIEKRVACRYRGAQTQFGKSFPRHLFVADCYQFIAAEDVDDAGSLIIRQIVGVLSNPAWVGISMKGDKRCIMHESLDILLELSIKEELSRQPR